MASFPKTASRPGWTFAQVKPDLLLLFLYQALAALVVILAPLLTRRWGMLVEAGAMADLGLSLPAGSPWLTIYSPYLVSAVYLLAGLAAISLRRDDAPRRLFALFSASVAIALAGLYDAYGIDRLAQLRLFSLALAGGALVHLAWIFPREIGLAARHPFIRYLAYIPLGLLLPIVMPVLARRLSPPVLAGFYQLLAAFLVLGVLFLAGRAAVALARSSSPLVREQGRLILLGTAIAFLPLLIWLVLNNTQLGVVGAPGDILARPFLLLPLTAFPLFLGYAVLRYRMLNTDYLLSRAALYGLLTLLVAAGYAILVSGLSLVVQGTLLPPGGPGGNPYLVGLAIFILALLLNPLRLRLQQGVDRAFFRGRAIYREQLQRFGRELTETAEFSAILAALRREVEQSAEPAPLHVFTLDETGTHYRASEDQAGQMTSEIRFAARSPLVQFLAGHRGAIYFDNETALPGNLAVERARVAVLGAQLFVPMPGQERLAGWLALGPRRSGEAYSAEVIAFLDALCDQASLALERALVAAAMERRAGEMDILARVAEAINVTLAFDDLLEMFYAQTQRLIPTVDFRITLGDEHGQEFHHVFFLENDERRPAREDIPIDLGQGLEPEVVRCRKAIATDDYERECYLRGVRPDAPGLFAWMSVPLNAGKDTIGAVSLGSRDPSMTYTAGQLGLFQSIADLAAGAIVKARLLDESQRRARQLATLNEMARRLASTLELDPLLAQILNGAVEILDCEAGLLVLVDEGSGEAEIALAAGQLPADLVGMRIVPGADLIAKSIRSRQGIIQNDLQSSEEWLNLAGKGGFAARDRMLVPIQIKERVIGVLEVLNKRDRLPFTGADLELIGAFAGQAAVAMENARLYTLTDRALAARVAELSVLQRIARQLNAGLDLERVMRITLDWALDQSRSEAGLIGIVEGDQVRVMGARGYPEGAAPVGDSLLDLSLSLWSEILNDQEPAGSPPSLADKATGRLRARTLAVGPAPGNGRGAARGFLPEAQALAVVPIRREKRAIGVLVLESGTRAIFPEDTLGFLAGLSEQAAIAISNAQLYAAIQSANLAKSQFVSSAAHELKNPLTSIKGYSDLLAGGAVGPVTEGQARFLATIRSNAERMSTLVSDLQDISRIEAGQLRLQFSAVSILEALDEVARTLRKAIEEKGQQLAIDLPPGPPSVRCDSTRLVQVLTNLLSNACKYTPPGGHLAIRAEPAANGWDPAGAERVVHFAVEDNGIGITAEDQRKIFQQFFRSEDPRVRELTGTGLGLTISKNLVEMQGGQIWFESVPGQGTAFHFTIPVAEAE